MSTGRLAALSVLALAGFVASAGPAHAGANVNVNVGIPVAVTPVPVVVAPQPVYVEEPREMVFIPQSNVYFAPGVSIDLFFYDNHWWNRRGDRWYRGTGYNGPWVAVGRRYVPGPVYHIPGNYRAAYGRERHIPYGQWKKAHWKHEGKRRGHDDEDVERGHDRGGRHGRHGD